MLSPYYQDEEELQKKITWLNDLFMGFTMWIGSANNNKQ